MAISLCYDDWKRSKTIKMMRKYILMCGIVALACSLCTHTAVFAESAVGGEKYILNENFNGTILDDKWILPEEMKIDTDGSTLTGIADKKNQTATLAIPEAVASGCVVIETRVKYDSENMGMDMSVNDSANKQRGYISFCSDGRLMGTDSAQSHMIIISTKNDDFDIQNGKWHTVRLIIELETHSMSMFIDKQLYNWDTSYLGDDIKYIKFKFWGNSATPFSLDYIKLYEADEVSDEDFTQLLGAEQWSGITGEVRLDNGMLRACPAASNRDVIFTLPHSLNEGIAIIETKIKYDGNNKGMNLSINDSEDNQRAYLSFTATSKLAGTNAEQNAMIDIIPKPSSASDLNIQNGVWHDVRLMIDFYSKSVNIIFDNKLYVWDTQYLGEDIKFVKFKFMKNSSSSFDVDYFKMYSVVNEELHAPVAENFRVVNRGDFLQTQYSFYDLDGDTEGKHKIEWYSAESLDGEYVLIPGAASDILSEEILENRFIKASITPVDSSQSVGKTVESIPFKWKWNARSIKEDHFNDSNLSDYWKNTVGVNVIDGVLVARQKQSENLWLNAFEWVPKDTGNYIIEFKARQTEGTDGFNLRVMDSNNNAGTQMGLFYEEQLCLTRDATSDAGNLAAFGDKLENGEWHTFRYFVNPETKKVAMMIDGKKLEWTSKYYADDLYGLEFLFNDGSTVNIDDLKIYSLNPITIKPISNVRISGVCEVGETVSGLFDGTSDGAQIRWLKSDSENGEYTAISNTSGQLLEITPNLAGKYIVFEVQPPEGDALRSDYIKCMTVERHNIEFTVQGVTASAYVSNYSGANKKFSFILAIYDNMGRLKKARLKTVNISNRKSTEAFLTDDTAIGESDTVKSFVWSDMKTAVPLSSAVSD